MPPTTPHSIFVGRGGSDTGGLPVKMLSPRRSRPAGWSTMTFLRIVIAFYLFV
jgi:hypothetical protein